MGILIHPVHRVDNGIMSLWKECVIKCAHRRGPFPGKESTNAQDDGKNVLDPCEEEAILAKQELAILKPFLRASFSYARGVCVRLHSEEHKERRMLRVVLFNVHMKPPGKGFVVELANCVKDITEPPYDITSVTYKHVIMLFLRETLPETGLPSSVKKWLLHARFYTHDQNSPPVVKVDYALDLDAMDQ